MVKPHPIPLFVSDSILVSDWLLPIRQYCNGRRLVKAALKPAALENCTYEVNNYAVQY